MYDIGAIRVGIGVVVLLLVVLLPVRQHTGSRKAFLGFLIGTAVALAAAALVLHLGDFVVEGAGDELVKGEIDHLQQAQAGGQVPRNLVIIEGSSQTDLGVNPEIVEAELSRLGYQATVVTLGLGGGNHVERYQHMHRLLQEMRRRGLALSPNTRLLMEVHSGYDEDPLRYLEKNQDALRTYSYATFDNLLFAARYYRLLGGRRKPIEREQLGILLQHTFMGELNIGMLPMMVRFDSMMGQATYLPIGEPISDAEFDAYDPQAFAPGARQPRVKVPSQAVEARTQRLQGLFGDALSGIAYFQLPSLDLAKLRYGHSLCAVTAQVCIDGTDPAIYGPLDHREYYYNPDHLTTKGAQLFSVYLADQLVARGLVSR